MSTRPGIPCHMQEPCRSVLQEHDGIGNRSARNTDPVTTICKIATHLLRDGILQGHLPQPGDLTLQVGD